MNSNQESLACTVCVAIFNVAFFSSARMATKLLRLVHDKKKEAAQGGIVVCTCTFQTHVSAAVRKDLHVHVFYCALPGIQ